MKSTAKEIMDDRQGKKSCNQKILLWTIIFSSFLVLLSSACSRKPPKTVDSVSELVGKYTDVKLESFQPGLSVYYRVGLWRRVSQMPKPESFVESGKPGGPITLIDHRFGKGKVFDSGLNRGVGVQMMGFLHLFRPGEWQFQVQSNDGIVVFIEETKVVSDPEWHSDRFSEPLGFQAGKSGWYPMLLRYFQRKGTATLEFYWKPPGEDDFSIIPEEAYWHVPKGL